MLLRVHLFDPMQVQFADALVSSAVVIVKKHQPTAAYQIQFTYGGTLFKPAQTEMISAYSLVCLRSAETSTHSVSSAVKQKLDAFWVMYGRQSDY
jgi:hypothetical protein